MASVESGHLRILACILKNKGDAAFAGSFCVGSRGIARAAGGWTRAGRRRMSGGVCYADVAADTIFLSRASDPGQHLGFGDVGSEAAIKFVPSNRLSIPQGLSEL